MARRSVILKPNIKRFHDALIESGLDVASIYSQLDLPLDVMSSEDGRISMGKYLQLMELAAAQSGNRYLSVERALQRDDSSVGMLAYLLKSAKNFRSAIDLLQNYLALVSPGSEVTSSECSDGSQVLTYNSGDFPVSQCVQDVEGTVMQLIKMFRNGLKDSQWWPEVLYFQHGEPSLRDAKECPFKTDVVYGHHFNGFCFSREHLDLPLEQYDPQLLKVLEPQAKKDAEALAPADNLLRDIQEIISRDIGLKPCDAESLSKQLGMSRSSLQRRLSEMGVTITDLREDIVFKRAKQALSDSSISITELSLMLGYSESSSFVRAFKRASGITPLQYRKQYQS